MRFFGISVVFCFFVTLAHAESINVVDIKPGELKRAVWEGLPVYVYKRTPLQIESVRSQTTSKSASNILKATFTRLAETYDYRRASLIRHAILDFDDKPSRSIRDDILVVLGMSSYFGCLVKLESNNEQFVDSCSNATYGLDGRLQRANNREIYHLLIPPHHYDGDNLVISSETKTPVELLDFSPDIMSMKISDGEKLIEAIQWKKKAVALSLLKRNKVLHYRTKTGATALHGAAGRSDSEVIEKMIQVGFDINQLTNSGITPLQMALLGGNEEAAITLIRLGAKTEAFCNRTACTKSALEFFSEAFPQVSRKKIQGYLAELHDDIK